MKRLTDLLYNIPILEIHGEAQRIVSDFDSDSRNVNAEGMFIAVGGFQTDGHQYINQAISQGAGVIICERLPDLLDGKCTYVVVKDSATALGLIASNFYNNPAEKLKVVGVTGTNGKTTVATLLFGLFRKLGFSVGLISTVCVMINDQEFPATLTTPDPKGLHRYFAQMVEAGCTHVFMEVSSHACHQKRIAGIPFTGGIFTNITHDHLDYHKTFENYLNAKKSFFDNLPVTAFALTNIDDRNGSVMVQNTQARIADYSLTTVAKYYGRLIENRIQGLRMYLNGQEVWFRLAGLFNAYNLTAVFGAALELGLEQEEALIAMSALAPVRGRFQLVPLSDEVNGIVDYAHTPDALQNVLETIHEINGLDAKIVCVVGCGGDRDSTKRPVMARIASELADYTILTSDNPRTESPEKILQEMLEGVPRHLIHKVTVITERKDAIKFAISITHESKIILIAGKGHETYQEINGVRFPFDDVIELQKAFHEKYFSN
jgi:UDP-N-acetylmuramoyl-L-alanyl-D-glutamate--2,6-diaminopimelate ligase